MDATPSPLYPRLLAPVIQTALTDTPVVCLLGPRQCGKTTLAGMLSPKRELISLDDPNYLNIAQSDPKGFVALLPQNATIDEVQKVPELLPAIKQAVDSNRQSGRFLLTGSANLLLAQKIYESLAGRMEITQLSPLIEAEKERQAGRFLQRLMEGHWQPGIRAEQSVSLDLPTRLVAGGYPEPLKRTPERARQWHRQYLRAIVERDIQDLTRIRDADQLSRLLELLALQTGQLLNISNLANDVGIHRTTVENYIAILERLFLLRRLPAWHRSSAKRLIKSPKVHLLDSGLAATLAGVRADDWLNRRSQMGHLLESFVVQQLIAQAAWTAPELRFSHYRDKDQLEVDLVIEQGKTTWGVEVKAASTVSKDDAHGLSRLSNQCGRDFAGGVLLYNGTDILPLEGNNVVAVPLELLWTC